jgi:hypothetical protein
MAFAIPIPMKSNRDEAATLDHLEKKGKRNGF